MRLPLLSLVALLAACGYRVDDCERPEQSFTFDEELTEYAIERFIVDSRVIDRSDLECDVVCEFYYLDKHPKGGASTVEVCKLTIDGDFTGDPKAVVGSLYCEGLGLPQFCVDA